MVTHLRANHHKLVTNTLSGITSTLPTAEIIDNQLHGLHTNRTVLISHSQV